VFFKSEELGAVNALEVLLLEVNSLYVTLEMALPWKTFTADVATVLFGIGF